MAMNVSIDLQDLSAQFRGLQGRHPGIWPAVPKASLLAGIAAALLLLAYLFYWSGLLEELETGRQQEETLKTQYADKLKKAVNLESLRKTKEQVGQYVPLGKPLGGAVLVIRQQPES